MRQSASAHSTLGHVYIREMAHLSISICRTIGWQRTFQLFLYCSAARAIALTTRSSRWQRAGLPMSPVVLLAPHNGSSYGDCEPCHIKVAAIHVLVR